MREKNGYDDGDDDDDDDYGDKRTHTQQKNEKIPTKIKKSFSKHAVINLVFVPYHKCEPCVGFQYRYRSGANKRDHLNNTKIEH